MSDFFNEAEDRLSAQQQHDHETRDAGQWKPGKGDRLTGVLLKAETRETRFGTNIAMFVRVVNEDSSDQGGAIDKGKAVLVWLGRARLDASLREQKPAPGKGLIIQFNGKVTPEGGGNATNDYTVVSEDTDPQYWGPLFDVLDGAAQKKVVQQAFLAQGGSLQQGTSERMSHRQPGEEGEGPWF